MDCFTDVFQGSTELHLQGTGGLQFSQGVTDPCQGMKERLLLAEETICLSPVVMVLNEVYQEG
jgi:hypothetical protein